MKTTARDSISVYSGYTHHNMLCTAVPLSQRVLITFGTFIVVLSLSTIERWPNGTSCMICGLVINIMKCSICEGETSRLGALS